MNRVVNRRFFVADVSLSVTQALPQIAYTELWREQWQHYS